MMSTAMRKIATFTAAGLLAAALAAPTLAQQYQMDPNAPLSVTAESQTEFNPDNCTITLQGKVEIIRDKTRLRSENAKAVSARERGDCGAITRLEARGNVFYVTPDQRIRADSADYDLTNEKAVFKGNVVAVQGEDVITSSTLTVELATNKTEAGGPFRGIFYPGKSNSK
jgi:lipopolysaccharide export system protein LptA